MRGAAVGKTLAIPRRRRPLTFRLDRGLVYILLTGFAIIFSIPFYWLVSTSLDT